MVKKRVTNEPKRIYDLTTIGTMKTTPGPIVEEIQVKEHCGKKVYMCYPGQFCSCPCELCEAFVAP